MCETCHRGSAIFAEQIDFWLHIFQRRKIFSRLPLSIWSLCTLNIQYIVQSILYAFLILYMLSFTGSCRYKFLSIHVKPFSSICINFEVLVINTDTIYREKCRLFYRHFVFQNELLTFTSTCLLLHRSFAYFPRFS